MYLKNQQHGMHLEWIKKAQIIELVRHMGHSINSHFLKFDSIMFLCYYNQEENQKEVLP